MVSKARLDFPEPETPVTTVSWFRGISTSTLLRLWTRAPLTTMGRPAEGGVVGVSEPSEPAFFLSDLGLPEPSGTGEGGVIFSPRPLWSEGELLMNCTLDFDSKQTEKYTNYLLQETVNRAKTSICVVSSRHLRSAAKGGVADAMELRRLQASGAISPRACRQSP